MILRRFMKHVTDQNWFAVGLDVIVVVVGIFLGMQVTEWNSDRQEKELERQYLQQLVRDINNLQNMLKEKIEFEEDKTKIGDELFSVLSKKGFSTNKKYIGAALVSLTDRKTVALQSATYIDLRSSGRLGLIRDHNLRTNITNSFLALERMNIVMEKNSKHLIDETYIPYLMSLGISSRTVGNSLNEDVITEVDNTLDNALNVNLKSDIMNQNDVMLNLDESAPEWNTLKVRLSWRVMVAVNDAIYAQQMLVANQKLKNELQDYLKNNS